MSANRWKTDDDINGRPLLCGGVPDSLITGLDAAGGGNTTRVQMIVTQVDASGPTMVYVISGPEAGAEAPFVNMGPPYTYAGDDKTIDTAPAGTWVRTPVSAT